MDIAEWRLEYVYSHFTCKSFLLSTVLYMLNSSDKKMNCGISGVSADYSVRNWHKNFKDVRNCAVHMVDCNGSMSSHDDSIKWKHHLRHEMASILPTAYTISSGMKILHGFKIVVWIRNYMKFVHKCSIISACELVQIKTCHQLGWWPWKGNNRSLFYNCTCVALVLDEWISRSEYII